MAISGKDLTAAEAETWLGIKKRTLNAWVARRRLEPAGRNEHGHKVYHLEHLLTLRDSPDAIKSRDVQARRFGNVAS